MSKIISIVTAFFPLWLILSTGLGFLYPEIFSRFKGDIISKLLGLIMLSMGMTLETEDFKRVLSRPIPVMLGVLLQYTIMPISGFMIAKSMGLDSATASGLILVSTCPGGTASNVLTLIAMADVALSVTMTVVSTMLGIVLTPLLATILIGNTIQFNGLGLFESTVQVVVFPVAIGVVLSQMRYADLHWFPLAHRILLVLKRIITLYRSFAPLVSIVMIILIVSSILSSSRDKLFQSPISLLGSVFFLHASGFFWGYLIIQKMKKDVILSRTISIEVGMQNSGLGVVLAVANFSDPFVAVPPAVSSLFHSLIASFLATIWNKSEKKIS